MAISKTINNETKKKPKMTAEEIILEQRRKTADILIQQIESNEKLPPWQRGYVFNFKEQTNPISHTKYSRANMIHLNAAALENGWQDTRWVTVLQMKEENQKLADLGEEPAYLLAKGSKGTKVEFHQEVYRDGETGKLIPTHRTSDNTTSDDKNTEHTGTFWIHKYYTVFNAEQFEKFPEMEKSVEKIVREENRNKFIENIIKNSEAKIYHDQVNKNYYTFDEIHLVPREHWKATESYYSTALHEIGHSTGHPSRLAREMNGDMRTKQYAREELVAEMTSALLHDSYNLERSKEFRDNNAIYLKNWSQALRKDPNVFVYAIRDAEKAVKYIEDHMLDKELKEELYAQYEAKLAKENVLTKEGSKSLENTPSISIEETKALPEKIPMTLKAAKNLSLGEKLAVLEAGIGISIYGTELPDGENNMVNIGGGNDAFGPEISKLAGGRDYEVSKDDKEPIIYTGKALNELVNDLGKEDAIDSQFGGFGYAKTYLDYYMKPLLYTSDLNRPMKDYQVAHDVRYDMGDGDFSLNENHIISYLEEAAADKSNPLQKDAKIYLAMAKDLEKANILTKPSFENNTDMLYKAMAISALRAYPDFDNHIGHMVRDFDMPGHDFLEAFQSDKTPVEILREFNEQTIVDRGPNLDTNVLTSSFQYQDSQHYHDGIAKALQLESLGKLIEKGHIDSSLFSEEALDTIHSAKDIADKINQRFSEFYIAQGYGDMDFVDNPSLRYQVAREAEPLLETMAHANERKREHTLLIIPHSVEEAHALTTEEKKAIFDRAFGVRINFMESNDESTLFPDPQDPTQSLEGLTLGGGNSTFGATISKLAGGHDYVVGWDEEQRHVIYTGKELNQLINDLQKEDLIRNQFSYACYCKVGLEHYLRPLNELNSDKPINEFLQKDGGWDYSKYNMGDSDFYKEHHAIQYLTELASKSPSLRKDAEIYLAIAKDLEKENILTKPSFENNTDILFKSMALASLMHPKSEDIQLHLTEQFIKAADDLQTDKSVIEIMEKHNIPSIVKERPNFYKKLLNEPVLTEKVLYQKDCITCIKELTHLEQVNNSLKKGYLQEKDLPKDLLEDIKHAEKNADKLSTAWFKHNPYSKDLEFYHAKRLMQDMFDKIPKIKPYVHTVEENHPKDGYTYTLPDEAFKEKSKDIPPGTSFGLYDPPVVRTVNKKMLNQDTPSSTSTAKPETPKMGAPPIAKVVELTPTKPKAEFKAYEPKTTEKKGKQRGLQRSLTR